MPLQFQNVATLSLQQQSRFFQAGFNYANTKSIRINGLLTDLTNSFGVTGIWTGIDVTQKNSIDYQPLIINGLNFGSGRITNITYDQGTDVRLKNYSASIEILDSGNLFNFTGIYYSGINLVNPQFLQDFNETWNFSRKQNGGYSSNHSASITFTTGLNNLNAIESAKTLAKTLFTGSNLGFGFYSGYSNKQGKRFFTESYNLISKQCSFNEKFDFNSDSGNYSATRIHNVSLDQQGVVNASERGSIEGIENPNFQKALDALAGELSFSYARCSGVAFSYFPSGATLINAPLSQSRSFDLFENKLTYEISYNNNPNNSGTYFWDYTTQISRNNGVVNISENGNVVGRGANPSIAFNAAQNGFLIVKSGISSRITSNFLTATASATNFLESKSESYTPFQGQVGYGYEYSNDPALIANNGVRKMEVAVEKTASLYSYNQINIFNYKQIVQDDKQSTIGLATVNVELVGDKTANLASFLPVAVAQFNSKAPVGNDRYVGNASYNYNINENTLSASLTWVYNETAIRTVYPK